MEQVRIIGCEQIDETQITVIAEEYAGKPLLLVNGQKIKQACMTIDDRISGVSVKKHFPNTLVVTVKEEQPLFYSGYQIREDRMVYLVVARSMKVLKITDEWETLELSYPTLTQVNLPRIAYCAEGEILCFEDPQNAAVLPTVIEAVEQSAFKNELCYVDFTTRFDIRIYGGVRADGGQAPRYEILLGNRKELTKKLTFAEGILEELTESFAGTISVEDPNSGYADPE